MYDLNKQLVGGAGWLLSFATQINDAGQIVGTGLFSGSDGTTVQHAFLLTPAPGPSINNIVGAGFSTPAVTSISTNGVFTIFGSGFATANAYLTSSDIVDNQLPTNLGGTCVESGTTKWGLFFVGPGQVNVLAGQLPATGTAPVTVVTNCGTADEVPTATVNVPVATVAPEFLYFLENSNGQNPVAAIEPNGAYIGTPGLISGASFAPAKAGRCCDRLWSGLGANHVHRLPGHSCFGHGDSHQPLFANAPRRPNFVQRHNVCGAFPDLCGAVSDRLRGTFGIDRWKSAAGLNHRRRCNIRHCVPRGNELSAAPHGLEPCDAIRSRRMRRKQAASCSAQKTA